MAHEFDHERMGVKLNWTPEDIIGTISLKTLLFSNDYRHIALKGILTSLVLLALGGTFAMLFRAELTVPGVQFIGARVYMTLMTMHGMVMVFGFLIPDARGSGHRTAALG
jgi:cytochrome c oxidase subunit 1